MCVYVGSRFDNGPLSIMDDPASILGRAVPVLMTGPVKFGYFQYGDRDLVMLWMGRACSFFGNATQGSILDAQY